MKPVLLLAVALLLALPATTPAENIALSDVIETLERPFRGDTPSDQKIHDFSADFFQVSKLASLDREQRGRGQVEIRFVSQSGERVPVAQFRWEYQQPNNQEIVSDGETLWVYMPENNQVIRSEIDATQRVRSDDPLTFLTGLGNLSRDFSIRWASPSQDPEGNYVLQLQPRRVSPLIRELRIVVDREAIFDWTRSGRTGRYLPILSSAVTDPNDNSTLIEFSDVRVNRGLSGMSFRFILPAGVDVVRPPEQGFGY